MDPRLPTFAAACLALGVVAPPATAALPDSRLKEVLYDPRVVLTVPVKRGIVTHVILDTDEAITEVASGVGAECGKPDSSWCVAAQPGGRSLFVKPKSGARSTNNLAVVTTRRTHALSFVVLDDADPRQPVYRLEIKAPPRLPARVVERPEVEPAIEELARPQPIVSPSNVDLVTARLEATAIPRNSNYSLAQGTQSEDILPAMVFDDGRFTYLRFPNNREVPAVFHVLGDGTETLVNARMEGDLLVVDRVSRRLVLRAGNAVVGIWNDAFDLDGVPPGDGTTVNGVRRVVKGAGGTAATSGLGGQHD